MIDGSPGERKKILLFSYTFSIILTILLLAMVITNLTWANFPTRPQWLINCTTKYESIILSFYSLVSFEKTVGPKFKYQTPKCHGIPLHDNYSCLVYSCKKKSYRIVGHKKHRPNMWICSYRSFYVPQLFKEDTRFFFIVLDFGSW